MRKVSYNSEIDIFDKDGRFLYIIKPSADIPNLTNIFFHKNRIGAIKNLEDRSVYEEFRVKNLKEIF